MEHGGDLYFSQKLTFQFLLVRNLSPVGGKSQAGFVACPSPTLPAAQISWSLRTQRFLFFFLLHAFLKKIFLFAL